MLALLVSGCGSSTQPASPIAIGQEDGGGVRVALLQPSGASNAAGLAGTLLVEDACLYISQAEGRKTLPAFTIPGIRWDSQREVLLVGQSEYRPGDRVLVSGAPPFPRQTLDWVQPPHPSCDPTSIVIVGSLRREGDGVPR